MLKPGSAKELIERELQEAVEQLQHDIARVEFWADALSSFAQPIPSYDAAALGQFILPANSSKGGRVVARVRPEN